MFYFCFCSWISPFENRYIVLNEQIHVDMMVAAEMLQDGWINDLAKQLLKMSFIANLYHIPTSAE